MLCVFSSESFFNECLLPAEAFMRGFRRVAFCFCGLIPYLLRLYKSVEVVLIGTK